MIPEPLQWVFLGIAAAAVAAVGLVVVDAVRAASRLRRMKVSADAVRTAKQHAGAGGDSGEAPDGSGVTVRGEDEGRGPKVEGSGPRRFAMCIRCRRFGVDSPLSLLCERCSLDVPEQEEGGAL